MEMGFWYEAEPSVAEADGSENCWLGRNLHDGLLFETWNDVSWLTELMYELTRKGSEDKAVWTGFRDEVVVEKPILDSILAGGETELDWTEPAGAGYGSYKAKTCLCNYRLRNTYQT